MAHILVVDDEERIRSMIRKYAEFAGYQVTEAENGMAAISLCMVEKFDVIIMDVMMPELDGFSTTKQIRKTLDVPVIMLSARGEEYDRIHGFEVGVDDYVVKPFSPKELMMRINVVVSRHQKGLKPQEETREVYHQKGLCVDFTGHIVTVDGVKQEMTPKEYDLLAFFIQNRNIALTREQLITKVWGYDYYGDDRTLDTHVKLLRNTLGPYRDFVVTLRGVGYRFDGE